MATLLLRLAAPLQAWGTGSRFATRATDRQPSKSAVIGLLAAADGRRRTDEIEDLLTLRFGVRSDQPGSVIRDFQTARALDESYTLPLTYRYYLGDAVFVAGVQGDDELVNGLAEALRRPAFPLYLGRRSCPPSQPVLLGVSPLPLEQALRQAPWQASDWYRRKVGSGIELEIVRDGAAGETAEDYANDEPMSFDPHRRRFATRALVRERCPAVVGRGPETTGGESAVAGSGPPVRREPRRRRPVTTHSPTDWWEVR